MSANNSETFDYPDVTVMLDGFASFSATDGYRTYSTSGGAFSFSCILPKGISEQVTTAVWLNLLQKCQLEQKISEKWKDDEKRLELAKRYGKLADRLIKAVDYSQFNAAEFLASPFEPVIINEMVYMGGDTGPSARHGIGFNIFYNKNEANPKCLRIVFGPKRKRAWGDTKPEELPLIDKLTMIADTLLEGARDLLHYNLETDEEFLDYVKKFPFLVTEVDDRGFSIFNTIFSSHCTYKRKLHLWNLLSKKLNISPFGRSLLCAVLESVRISETKKDEWHGCGCCQWSDDGFTFDTIIDDLLRQGHKIHEYDEDRGFYPIHVVAHSCQLSYIKWFMEKYDGKQDINKVTPEYGSSPLIMVVKSKGRTLSSENDVYEVVEYFIKLGAKLDIVTKDGHDALFHSVDCGYPRVFKLLLDNGVKLDLNKKYNDSYNKSKQVTLMDLIEKNKWDKKDQFMEVIKAHKN
jgi:hypothetical protein